MAYDSSHWMEEVGSKNKGKLHRRLHVPQRQKIPAKKLEAAEHSDDVTERREAIAAENMKRFGGRGHRQGQRK